ncbi:unnamed protein product [Absidia cylindrospora]
MPFRCKCGRTFEKPDTFSTHTSGCAPFHQRKLASSSPPLSSSQAQTSPSSKVAPLEMSRVRRISIRPTSTISTTSMDQSSSSSSSPSSLPSSPLSASSSPISSMDYPVFMPTALSIQNAFEGVRRRSLSYGASLK